MPDHLRRAEDAHLYKNGKLIRRDNRGPLSFSNWSREYPLVVGTDASGRSQWKGILYEVAIFDRALTSRRSQGSIRSVPSIRSIRSAAEAAGKKPVTGDQWPVTSKDRGRKDEIAAQPSAARNDIKTPDNRPLIHYVFKPENTYETEFRGKKAVGVRDLGKGEPVDLVIPEHFTPYERVYLGWDPDWMKRNSDWLDLAVNIIGFLPFGFLAVLALGKRGTRDEGVGTSAAERQGRPVTSDQWPVTSARKIVAAVVLAVVVGFVVSFAIEFLQAYLPSRDSSLRDLMTNTLGTALGAGVGAYLIRRSGQWSVAGGQ